jgi:hypothetical protein
MGRHLLVKHIQFRACWSIRELDTRGSDATNALQPGFYYRDLFDKSRPIQERQNLRNSFKGDKIEAKSPVLM